MCSCWVLATRVFTKLLLIMSRTPSKGLCLHQLDGEHSLVSAWYLVGVSVGKKTHGSLPGLGAQVWVCASGGHGALECNKKVGSRHPKPVSRGARRKNCTFGAMAVTDQS